MVTVRATARGLGRRIGLFAVLVLLATLITWAHSAPAMDGMPEAEAMAVCLAITQTGAVALGLFALVAGVGPRLLRVPRLSLIPQRMPQPRAVRARAGPAALQVFLR